MDASTPAHSLTDGAAVGWRLDETDRDALLERIPPAYPDVLARNVTLTAYAAPGEPLPPPCAGQVIGEADDGAGVQCLVLEVGGSWARPNGGVFHVVWSVDPARGRHPRESNGVIAWVGWREVAPAAVRLIPGRF